MRKTMVEPPPRASREVPEMPPWATRPRFEETKYRDAGLAELLSVMALTWRGGSEGVARHDPVAYGLYRALSGYAGGVSGGFLLKPEWAEEIFDKARLLDGPLARCLIGKTQRREFYLPGFWETSRADGQRWGGVWGRWRGAGSAEIEALEGIASQPSMSMVNFEVKRLMVYTAPISRDLVADSTLFKPMMDTAVFGEFRFQIEAGMLTGQGENFPLGVVYSPATITVAKDSGQSSGTISTANIDGMWKAIYGPCRRNVTWHCNDDTQAAIDEVASAANWPQAVYLPQGVNGNAFPLIKGRPLISAEQLPAIGSPGDLVACDWSQYVFVYHLLDNNVPDMEVAVGLPPDAVESTRSEHLLFDTDSIALKWKMRADGKLLWPKQLTNINGAQVGPCAIIAKR